ncbi:MAG TPA: MFS transporter [Solirubrobacteraceae bacterium]|nr:MFS transporter [Solirubrobacteraceae bacterium]
MTARGAESGWAPLRHPDFRRLWSAQFTSNVGSWMQTVAAQWVMTSLTSSALLLSAIPAAGSIPVLLLAAPAGTLGDLVDRRMLILLSQATMLVAAAGLAILSVAGSLRPWDLLLLLSVIGVGGAASAPTWQTLQPELVPPEDRAPAIALGSVNQNLARAVGPAIGGVLLAATSAALVFLTNAVSFVAVLGAIAITRIPARTSTLPREHALAAARAGGRYVRNSPALLALIALVFMAGAVWALLPLVARHRLGLGSGGYGLLLGCVGVGALLAATFGPGLRAHLSPRQIYAGSRAIVAGGAALLAVTHSVAVAAVALIAAGACWITGLGLLSTGYQGQLRPWVKARGFAYYLVAFQGASGIGSMCLGGVASASSVSTALWVICAGLVASMVVTWPLALPGPGDTDALMAEPMPLPQAEQDIEHGPVAVTWSTRSCPAARRPFWGRRASCAARAGGPARRAGTCIATWCAPTCSPRSSWSGPGRSTSASTRASSAPTATCSPRSTRCCSRGIRARRATHWACGRPAAPAPVGRVGFWGKGWERDLRPGVGLSGGASCPSRRGRAVGELVGALHGGAVLLGDLGVALARDEGDLEDLLDELGEAQEPLDLAAAGGRSSRLRTRARPGAR